MKEERRPESVDGGRRLRRAQNVTGYLFASPWLVGFFVLALGLRMYQQVEGGSFMHYLMAASVVALSPPLLLFFFAQRYITKGLLLTGTKG